ncbi:MAG: AAA family ATPase [Bacillota bacterium]|nr:AAA family ATPase [Bacillota bacterium]
MNIKEAKEQIQNAIRAYFTKDENGDFIIPAHKQRPVFLMGPPGIGKTAIMEQIASEMGIGLLSYSMTHHTRQSALGLPFIEKKVYDGKEYAVSEYTMSEIIASIYDVMEESGVKEGILFLDEINCVSETLSPIMLQFLQYKVFGKHKVPKGWIVVTAGNPPEYNDSVREFDMVTWDRLKRIDVEARFDVWKEYAYKIGVHPAIMSYLEIKKDCFYKVEQAVEGKSFVTARGWDDLSQMMFLYEQNEIKVDETLISQYLQNKQIASDFSIYLDLFNKYRSDYRVDRILAGAHEEELIARAKDAKFDERLSLIGLLLDAITQEMKELAAEAALNEGFKQNLFALKDRISGADCDLTAIWRELIQEHHQKLEKKKLSSSIDSEQEKALKKLIRFSEGLLVDLSSQADLKTGFQFLKDRYLSLENAYQVRGRKISERLGNVFRFLEACFEEGTELLVFMSELSINPYTANFVSKFACKEYFAHNKKLLHYERREELLQEIESLEIE